MLSDLVEQRRDELGPAEQRVADFLVEQRHRVGHLSAAKIASEAGTSDATVVRTARALGFTGLGALREYVASELAPAERLAATLSSQRRTKLSSLLDERMSSVASLDERVDEATLSEWVRHLATAPRIVAVGFGPAAHVAGYFAHQLRRVGATVVTIGSTGPDLADELLDLAPGDVVVLLSYDERSPAAQVVLDRAGEVRAPVLLITDDPRRPAALRADSVLPVGRGTPGQVISHAATMVVLEVLIVGVAAASRRRADRSLRTLQSLRERLGAGGRRT
jgi:DNA-binding MurR/RpiR family transcriptional regulator